MINKIRMLYLTIQTPTTPATPTQTPTPTAYRK